MEVTDIRVFLLNKPPVKAYANIVFDNCFLIKDIKVIEGKKGLFVAMPSKKMKNGDFTDVVHPINTDTRRWLDQTIIDAYHKQLDKSENQNLEHRS
ncbi:MAG: septation protein SpoVG [Candidatus Cloacimonadota bacterium]|nr:MAG: septation protein SpoVG [Candidatus Cloacimonadota bacterium]